MLKHLIVQLKINRKDNVYGVTHVNASTPSLANILEISFALLCFDMYLNTYTQFVKRFVRENNKAIQHIILCGNPI